MELTLHPSDRPEITMHSVPLDVIEWFETVTNEIAYTVSATEVIPAFKVFTVRIAYATIKMFSVDMKEAAHD